MALTQTDQVLEAWLAKAIATGGPYDPAATFVGMATALTNNGSATVIGDITEATGDAGTRVPVAAWSAPYRLNDGRWAADGPICVYRLADGDAPQTLTHFFYATALTAGVLKAFGPLSAVCFLNDEDNQLSFVPRITIDPAGQFGAEISWNG